mmetsp:Transcript_11913/g.11905  ORF Transcript_11913/g.11905 Transcript_11913/m.11905 type:complete len:451 (-) Transcript_11913:48-1400(-)
MATIDQYQILRDLGSGAFSQVKLGKHIETGDLVALKIIKDDDSQNGNTAETFKTEIEIMSDINHPNIINMLSSTDDGTLKEANGDVKENVFYLALELASGGELFDFIAQTGSFSEPVARFYFHQMMDAFEYLHSKGISHRDMKPDNIMLDNEFNLKIADFGFSSKTASNQSFKGTRSYMAPEILIGGEYHGQMVDIFAAGIILFIMVTQIPPFQMAHPKDGWYKFVCSNRMDKFWKYHGQNQPGGIEFFSKSFIDLINWLFNFDHTTRPSLSEIKEHEWYNGPVATKDEITEEFTKRQAMLDQCSDDAVPETDVPQEVYDSKSVHRDIKGNVEDSSNLPVLHRKEAEYIACLGSFTKFFSESPLEELFATIAQFAITKSSDYEFSASEYSIIMNIADESEQRVKLQINIMSSGENKHCIEAVKLAGDRFQFNDIYKEIKGFFGGHINTTA